MPLDGSSKKLGRDAFLYMDPRGKPAQFAQCETCRTFMPGKGWCASLDTKVYPDSSCGLYFFGIPTDRQEPKRSATATEAGLVHREVRCENCSWFDDGHCGLFAKLNRDEPDVWDLDERVDRHGCCNAQTPKREHRAEGGAVHVGYAEGGDAADFATGTPPPPEAPPPFDASKPFTPVAEAPPPFDPSKPFTPAAPQQAYTKENPFLAPKVGTPEEFEEKVRPLIAGLPPSSYYRAPSGKLYQTPAAPIGDVTAAGEPIDYGIEGAKEIKPPSAIKTGLHALESAALPTAAGVAGFAPGFEIGAGLGAFTGPIAPVASPVLGILGGSITGYLSSRAAQKAQDTLATHIPDSLKEIVGQDDATKKAEIEAHPWISQYLPEALNLAFFRPGAVANVAREGAGPVERFVVNQIAGRAPTAALMGAQTAGIEAAEGQPLSASEIGKSALIGSVLNQPTGLGHAAMRLGAAPLRPFLPARPGEAVPAAAPATAAPLPPVGSTFEAPMPMPEGGTAPARFTVTAHVGGDAMVTDTEGVTHRMAAADLARVSGGNYAQPAPAAATAPAEGPQGAPQQGAVVSPPAAAPLALPPPAQPEIIQGPQYPWTSTGTGMLPPPQGFVMGAPEAIARLSANAAQEAAAARAAAPPPTVDQRLAASMAQLNQQATTPPPSIPPAPRPPAAPVSEAPAPPPAVVRPPGPPAAGVPETPGPRLAEPVPEEQAAQPSNIDQTFQQRREDQMEAEDQGIFEAQTREIRRRENESLLAAAGERWAAPPLQDEFLLLRPAAFGQSMIPPWPGNYGPYQRMADVDAWETAGIQWARSRGYIDEQGALTPAGQQRYRDLERSGSVTSQPEGWSPLGEARRPEAAPAATPPEAMPAAPPAPFPAEAITANMRQYADNQLQDIIRANRERGDDTALKIADLAEAELTRRTERPTGEAPQWMRENTSEGRRQLAIKAGFSPQEAVRLSRMNWPALEREPETVARLEDAWRRGIPEGITPQAPLAPAEIPNAPVLTAEKHTKTGADIFAVRFPQKPDIADLGTQARKNGGRWSSFRGGGMQPGWLFKTRDDAERFAEWARGQLPGGAAAQAEAAGRAAFAAGIKRVSATDPAFMRLLRTAKGSQGDLITAWNRGWDAANIAEPVPGVPTPGAGNLPPRGIGPAAADLIPEYRQFLENYAAAGHVVHVSRVRGRLVVALDGKPPQAPFHAVTEAGYRRGETAAPAEPTEHPGLVVQPLSGGPPEVIQPPGTRQPSDWTEIGKNYIGQTLYEDQRGVRSLLNPTTGIRHTEPVGMRPTRGGMQIEIGDRTERPEYQLATPHPTTPNRPVEYKPKETRGTRSPQEIADDLEKAREDTNPDPTDAQKESGNYAKGKASYHGIPFVMETPRGEMRRGVGADGRPWEVEMPVDYGYISRTEGADGDHVDAYIGPRVESQRAFVVDQVHADTGAFDEHKVMLGFNDWREAREAYIDAFSDGRGADRIGNVTSMSLDELKDWLKTGDTRSPIGQAALPLGERPAPAAAATAPTRPEAAPAAARPYGSANKIVDQDAYTAARERMRQKLGGGQLNVGIDPTIFSDGVIMAAYHIEAGAHKFADFARAMVADVGDAIRPYLHAIYEGARRYPGIDASGMTPEAEVLRELAAGPTLTPSEETGHGVPGTLPAGNAGAGPEAVHGSAPSRPAGSASTAENVGGIRNAAEPLGPAQEPGAGGTALGGGSGAGHPDNLPAGEAAEGERGAAGRPAGPVGGRPQTGRVPDADVKGTNHVIEPGSLAEERSPRVKARDNLAAIELAKQISDDARSATKEEQAALARYVGWGGLANIFPDPATGKFRPQFEQMGQRLQQLLTPDEYRTAARSTQYAHYTSEPVIRAMWQAVDRMGFKGGSVFEPGMGIGHFLGMMPPDIAAASKYQGIEFDHLTSKIAKLLYPESGVRQADFIRTPMPEGAFDLAIGNPPFSDTVIRADPKYAARGFMLHDYFFAKSLDSVRPGGLLAFVTSAGTMNKMDGSARRYMAERAEFVGGVRLPSTAFAKNAGTEVTTDILFFKKRPSTIDLGEKPPDWTETVFRALPNARGAMIEGPVSRYFSEHPEMVLGEEGFFDKLYKDRYAVHETPGTNLEDQLREAFARLPENVMDAPLTPEQKAALDFSATERKDDSYYVGKDGRLMQYSGGAGRPVLSRGAGVEGGKTAAEIQTIRELLPIRDALREVFQHDLAEIADQSKEEGGTSLQAQAAARAKLNRVYDDFVKKNGPINKAEFSYRRPNIIQQESARAEAREDARELGEPWEEGTFDPTEMIAAGAKTGDIARARRAAREEARRLRKPFDEGTFNPEEMADVVITKRRNIDPFRDDQESYRLRALETYDEDTGVAEKRRVFFENTLTREQEPEIRSAQDGILWSVNKFGRLDVDAIAEKMGVGREQVIGDLGDVVMRLPGTEDVYEPRDAYLSGDVVSKLEEAKAAAERDPRFGQNVAALEAAQPEPLSPAVISMSLGMPWIPPETTADFAASIGIGRPTINYAPLLGQWIVRGSVYGPRSAEWGTADYSAYDLLAEAMNRRNPVVRRRDRDGHTWVDANATQAAQDKVQALKDAFSDWAGQDPERAHNMAVIYNGKYNRVVLRNWNGDYLTTPGVSADWKWRPHQTRVIARIVQDGNTYMAHAVGAGKTSAMIGAGMEMRRLGLINKPMYVVPNHMLGQFAKEFYEQYPTARIMVADDRNFHTSRRKQFVANIAQQDLDAVIITNSAFKMIPISGEFSDKMVREAVDEIDEALRQLGQNPNDTNKLSKGVDPADRFTVKRLQSRKEKLEQKLLGATTGQAKDVVNTFEELGVDFLFVDEAHQFRKLSYVTQTPMKGINPEGSDMAWDLYTKIRYLDENRPGRSVVMASGTPITNTMGELYSLSRYIQPEELKDRGLSHFDSWAQSFGDTKTEIEQTAAGNYEPVTRFAKFVNLPELFKMVGSNMDVVTSEQLAQYVTRPELEGGGRNSHVAPQTDWMKAFQDSLGQRVAAIRARRGPAQKGEDILLSVITDGRKGAIDPRLVDPKLPSDPASKLNMMIDNVYRIWKETKNQQFYDPATGYQKEAMRGPATQMVFSNYGIDGSDGKFSAYDFMRREWIRRGIPANEIAFIRDYSGTVAKQRVINDMNEGKVRILVGSTEKMGTGINAQRRLIAIHNLDPLWFPADDEQRNGRGLRQGNLNRYLQIHDYSTKGTYDSTMWSMMARKGRFIEQFFRGDPNLREIEDLGAAGQYEQAAAMSTADERIIKLTELRQELQKMERRASAHRNEQYTLEYRTREAERDALSSAQSAEKYSEILSRAHDVSGDNFRMVVSGREFTKRADAAQAINEITKTVFPDLEMEKQYPIGEIGGFPLSVEPRPELRKVEGRLEYVRGDQPLYTLHFAPETEASLGASTGIGVIQLATQHIQNLPHRIEGYRESAQTAAARAESNRNALGKPFADADKIEPLRQQIAEMEAELQPPPRPQPGAAEEAGPFGAREEAPPFFSALTRAVEAIPQPRAPGAQWANLIRNLASKGVKQDEVDWSGVMDWLKDHPGAVTKDELLDQLRANEVRVEEVEKGEELGVPDEPSRGPTRYGQYTLPGGENYRELLLTLPPMEQTTPTGPRGWYDPTNPNAAEGDVNYRSAHWQEPNILAHIRFDDRTDAEGRKVLHVAEVQSDWHQQGRRRGYQGEPISLDWSQGPREFLQIAYDRGREVGAVERMTPTMWRAFDDRGSLGNFDSEQEAKAALERQMDKGVRLPNAPFKTQWPELAMKRVLRYAAEHGYDRVTWDTGETQMARYDLSKQIPELAYWKDGDEIGLSASDHSGNVVLDQELVAPEKLPDMVGKEVADRILSGEGSDHSEYGYPSDPGVKFLRGDNLRVGGAGMRGFYDKMLPAFLNRYAKKWGAKVERGEVTAGSNDYYYVGPAPSEGDWSRIIREGWDRAVSLGRQAQDVYLDVVERGVPLEDAMRENGSRELAEIMGGEMVTRFIRQPVHAIDITPQMRESVMHQGQALWQGTEGPQRAPFRDTSADFERLVPWHAQDPQEAARLYVLHQGEATGNEYLAAYDARTGTVAHVGTSDMPNFVGFPDWADGSTLIVHHNHPSGNSLSPKDVQMLALGNIGQIVAHAGDDVFAARLTPEGEALGRDGLEMAGALARQQVYNTLAPEVDAGHLSADAANRIFQDVVNRALAHSGIIDYVSTREPAGEIAQRAIQSAAEWIGKAFGKDFPAIRGAENGFHDRSAGTVRPEAAMAGLSRSAEEIASRPRRPELAEARNQVRGNGPGAAGEERGLAEERPPESDEEIARRIAAAPGGEGGGRPPTPPAPGGGAPPGRPEDNRLNADLARIMHTDNRSWFDRMRETVAQIREGGALAFRQYWQDQLAALETQERSIHGGALAPGRISASMSAREAKNWHSVLDVALTHAQVRYNPDEGVMEPIAGKKPLRGILAQLTADEKATGRNTANAFAMWQIVKRAERLMAEGRERNVPASMIERYRNIDQEYQRPDGSNLFHDVDRELQDWHSNLLDLGEAAGLINAESRALWEHADYVPFYRALEDEKVAGPTSGSRGIANARSPIRYLRGGEAKINNVYENLVMNAAAMIRRSMANIAMQKARTELVFNTDALIPMSREARVPYGDPAVQEALRAAGLDPQALSEEAKQGARDLFGALKRRDPDVISVMDKGKSTYYRVRDPLLLQSLTAAGPRTVSGIAGLLAAPARLLRAAVVFDPAFALAHNLRMAQHAYILTGASPVASISNSLRQLRGLDPIALKLMAAGAMSGRYDIDLPRHVRAEITSPEYQHSLIDTPLKAARFVRDFGEAVMRASDIGPRVAVYKRALAQGASEAEAINAARDLLDFSTHGAGNAALFLAQTIPFLNARWQGMARTYRGFTGEDRNAILMRGALVAAATAALWYQNKDDPEYQRKPDWDRQYAWQIKVAPGVWFRLPKPFELGALFGSIPEILLEYERDGSTRALGNAMGALFENVFKFNPIPVAIRPGLEAWWNRDSYTGQPIVNEREQQLLPDLRYGPTDSQSVIALTQAYNSVSPWPVAPAVVQHLLRGYLAGFGAYITGAADWLGDQAGLLPSQAAPAQTPIVGRFVHETPEASNRIMGEYYDLRRSIDAVGNSIRDAANHHDAALVARLRAQHPEYSPGIENDMNAAGTELSQIRGIYQKTEMNPNISGEQKTQARDAYYRKRDQILDTLRPKLRRAEGLPATP